MRKGQTGSMKRKNNRIHIPHVRHLAILFIMVILCYPEALPARDVPNPQEPGLTASLNKESVPVGGIVELTLSFHLPEGAKIGSPPEIKGLEGLTVLERETGEGTIRLRLLVDKLGSWKTGEISLSYRDRNGQPSALKTGPLSVTVLSNLGEKPEEARLKPIQDIIPVSPFWMKVRSWLILLLIVILIGLGLLYVYRRRKIRSLTAELMDPPHVRARRELSELEARMLFEKGDVKAFYFRFSEIIRQYLESLRGFHAVEYTTEEIASRIREEQDRILLPLLRQADLAKFAENRPSSGRKDEEVKTVLSYIERTCATFENDIRQDTPGGNVR